ncbi:MAG: calcium-binding protein [Gammaproteobacteria bacterium]
MKATKRSRPGRRPKRKHEALFPLRRPALLAALGLWAPAGAADFPPILELSSLDGTNGFRLNGVAGNDRSGFGNDAIRGRGGNDVLCGGDGRDRLFGGPGRDRLFGDNGRDALNGGTGRDRCDGGAGTDTARRCEVRGRVP